MYRDYGSRRGTRLKTRAGRPGDGLCRSLSTSQCHLLQHHPESGVMDRCSSGGSSDGEGGGSNSFIRGRPWLRFPPPPPFPPGGGETSAQPPTEPYDYAYYLQDPGPSTSKGIRHSYTTRYGTQENLYEEITQHPDQEEELRYVHSKHLQVLNELNLSMEAMLMPDESPPAELTGEELLSSPATSSLDSGFSGSSTGSNSLGRPTPTVKKKSPHGHLWRRIQSKIPTGPASIIAHAVKPNTNEVGSTVSWEAESSRETSRRSSCSDVDFSSGDESNRSSLEGGKASRSGPKRCVWRKSSSPDLSGGVASRSSGSSHSSGSCNNNNVGVSNGIISNCSPGGGSSPSTPTSAATRFSRWFSMKKPSSPADQEHSPYKGKMPLLLEEDEIGSGSGGVRRVVAPSLPPPPATLTHTQLKMRHIVEAIVQSENSYLNTLHRLVHDYKRPLEEKSPAILSTNKILTLFHRVPEILQCHTLFSIALAEAVANWDRDQRIGDVFVASFSKAVVLDVYSDFINNFSLAMDLARSETVKKPALAEFFKSRQVTAHDRMSFFGLMVKPVQRFPQFILFLQDLLQNTGQGHPERMSLQLALTQLEQLAELLNERKRESEQAQAFRSMMRGLSAKMPATAAAAHHHKSLLRHDDVTQLEVNQCGLISKCKSRRLLLLNDQLICVSMTTKEETSQPRLAYKWSCPIADVHVIEPLGSPTMNRLLTPSGSLTSNSSDATDNLCMEMSQLMHDYQVISRIHDLSQNLKGCYPEINVEVTRSLLDNIQRQIQRKDEQMAWLDSCCLQLSIRGKEDVMTFQMQSQEARREWITELRMARLALDPNNSPAWEIPEQELRPSTKMPLFVNAHPVYTAQPSSEVNCGCFYTSNCGKYSYLWVGTSDGVNSYISVAQTVQTTLKPITQVLLNDAVVTSMEYIRSSETVWIGTGSNRLLIYSVCEVEHPELVDSVETPGGIVTVKYHCDNAFVSTDSGFLLVFRKRMPLNEREELQLGNTRVSAIVPIGLNIFAACGKTVFVISAISGELQKSYTLQHEHLGGNINLMAHSGVGLWLSLDNSSTICLYHTETFKHLQDINVASTVVRVTGCPGAVTVTALLATRGLLWVGSDSGVVLTVPLPRLEGVPTLCGRVSVAVHAHCGPVTLLMPLAPPPSQTVKRERRSSRSSHSDVYSLYGQLMYVKDCHDSTQERPSPRPSPKEHTLITLMGGKGYINYQQCSYKSIPSPAHIILWETKL